MLKILVEKLPVSVYIYEQGEGTITQICIYRSKSMDWLSQRNISPQNADGRLAEIFFVHKTLLQFHRKFSFLRAKGYSEQ